MSWKEKIYNAPNSFSVFRHRTNAESPMRRWNLKRSASSHFFSFFFYFSWLLCNCNVHCAIVQLMCNVQAARAVVVVIRFVSFLSMIWNHFNFGANVSVFRLINFLLLCFFLIYSLFAFTLLFSNSISYTLWEFMDYGNFLNLLANQCLWKVWKTKFLLSVSFASCELHYFSLFSILKPTCDIDRE